MAFCAIAFCMPFLGQSATFVWSCDALNRLTNAAYSDGSRESYSYDQSGNRLLRVTLAATTNLDVSPPTMSSNIVTTAFSPSQWNVAWLRSVDYGGSGMGGYQILLNGSLFATTTKTNFILTGLMPSSSYCLAVVAFDHYNNFSTSSYTLCTNTAAFQPPFLYPLGFIGGRFQVGVTGGTPGPYNVMVSTQLPQFSFYTNMMLPQTGTNFKDSTNRNYDQRFFLLNWRTNSP